MVVLIVSLGICRLPGLQCRVRVISQEFRFPHPGQPAIRQAAFAFDKVADDVMGGQEPLRYGCFRVAAIRHGIVPEEHPIGAGHVRIRLADDVLLGGRELGHPVVSLRIGEIQAFQFLRPCFCFAVPHRLRGITVGRVHQGMPAQQAGHADFRQILKQLRIAQVVRRGGCHPRVGLWCRRVLIHRM